MKFLDNITEYYLINRFFGKKIYTFNQEDYINAYKSQINQDFYSGLCIGFTYLFAKYLATNFKKNKNLTEFTSYLKTDDFIPYLESVMVIQLDQIKSMNYRDFPDRKNEIELKRNLRKLAAMQRKSKEYKIKFEEIIDIYVKSIEKENNNLAVEKEFIKNLKANPKNELKDKIEVENEIKLFSKNISNIYNDRIQKFRQLNNEDIASFIPNHQDNIFIEKVILTLSLDLNFLINNFYKINFCKIYSIFPKDEFYSDLVKELNILKYNELVFRTIGLPTTFGGHYICYAITKSHIYFFDSNYGIYCFDTHRIKEFSEFLTQFILSKYKFIENKLIISNSLSLSKKE